MVTIFPGGAKVLNELTNPRVSFIVPCYKLGKLLRECVDSILSQSFAGLEIIIMDDCSPDDTGQVAEAIPDLRVKYVRNETNLGHLRNYNKGLSLALGEYVWLISADDRLRVPYVLARYVELMDKHPNVAYVCCGGVEIDETGRDTRVLEDYSHADEDSIFPGHRFIPKILESTGILAASVMVRKACYERVGVFPLDLPHRADIYLWCMLAMEYDAAFLVEPMIDYRCHAASMMSTFMRTAPQVVIDDELAVLWRVKREAERRRDWGLARKCESLLGSRYAFYIASLLYEDRATCLNLSLTECESSIDQLAQNPRERRRVRGQLHAHLGDQHYWHKDYSGAAQCYQIGLLCNPAMPKIWIKYLSVKLGGIGIVFRASLRAARRFRSEPAKVKS